MLNRLLDGTLPYLIPFHIAIGQPEGLQRLKDGVDIGVVIMATLVGLASVILIDQITGKGGGK